jgi:hypothetical protein
MNPSDRLALEFQNLYQQGRIDTELGLLKIDYRDRAAEAPFRFDMVHGTLHRSGCPAISEASESAVYAVWQPGPGAQAVACSSCRPALSDPPEGTGMNDDRGSDIVYGFVSILDQFGSVLKERGREYRNSSRGRQLTRNFDDLVSTLDQTQREALKLTLSSLDGLIKAIDQVNDRMNHQPESDNERNRDEV